MKRSISGQNLCYLLVSVVSSSSRRRSTTIYLTSLSLSIWSTTYGSKLTVRCPFRSAGVFFSLCSVLINRHRLIKREYMYACVRACASERDGAKEYPFHTRKEERVKLDVSIENDQRDRDQSTEQTHTHGGLVGLA